LKSVNNLAVALAVQGRLEEASKLVEETARIQRRLLGREDLFTLRSTYNLAIMWRHLGRIEESRRLFEETLPIMRRVLGPQHQDTLRVMTEYGELVLDDGRAPEAYQLFEEALRGKMSILGPKHVETLIAAGDLADALRALTRLEEARKRAEEVVEQHRELLGAEHPQTLVVLTILANVLRDQGRYAEARTRYEETLSLARSVLGPKTPETQRLMRNFAWMLATASDLAFRDPPRAVALAKELVEHAPGFTDNWTVLGVASYRAGHWKDAVAALEKAESLAPGQYADVNAFFLAMSHRRLGDDTAARGWYDQAVERMNKNQPEKEELHRIRAEAAELLKVNEKND
jgi:tetratricopeptide (TPR) repeat protein